ncbi:MAG: sulfur oxidation c-type cytochrome SoxA [Burkholderiaceae bacterium]
MSELLSLRRMVSSSLLLSSLCFSLIAHAQDNSAVDEIAKYRQLLADGNPAELWEARGEGLWKEPRGPNQVALTACDLGKGPGIVKGAYVELPRYFADTRKVMDLEQRLAYCMVKIQGFTNEQATANHFGQGEKRSQMEALAAYIAGESRGMKIAVKAAHPEEARMYAAGKSIFFFRGGAYDFSCASCHSGDKQRIRLQELPNLLVKEEAQKAYATWPAYRVSQGEVRTMQHRLYDCFRQQRFPVPGYDSDMITALTLFLAKNADGGTFDAPALKR